MPINLTSKQRAALRSMAANTEALHQLGHEGVSLNFIHQINAALDARELIKISVLETCPLGAGEAASELAEATDSVCVCTIGRKVVLFRTSRKPENRKIDLRQI